MVKPFKPRPFIDSLRVYVKGGTGGKGLPRYGGVGGNGGNIYICGQNRIQLKGLRDINEKLRFVAGSGQDSSRHRLVGGNGADVEIPVPLGVIVKLDNGRILGDLDEEGERVMVSRGGAGGQPANGFQQQKGQMLNVNLDLKVIADVGLVGFPNAGKSTLLRAVSRAAPKIAAYPFTTMQPHIGVMHYDDTRQIKVADLPGLIEGAHINIGLGHAFLKHVERCKILLFMADLSGFRLKVDSPMRDPFETIVFLMKELELFNQTLCNRPAALILNKIDIPGNEEIAEKVQHKIENLEDYLHEIPEPLWPETPVKFREIFTLSAKDRIGTDYLKQRLRETLDEIGDEEIHKRDTLEDFESKLAHELSEHHGAKLI